MNFLVILFSCTCWIEYFNNEWSQLALCPLGFKWFPDLFGFVWKWTCVNTLEIVNGTLTPLGTNYPY